MEGTCIMTLGLDQDLQAALKNKIGNFDEENLQKAYVREQGKYYKIVTISSKSCQIGRKLKIRTKTVPPPGFNIAPAK